jgi:hypothetical protein
MFIVLFAIASVFLTKQKNSPFLGGQYAGMSDNIFSKGGQYCRNGRQKLAL